MVNEREKMTAFALHLCRTKGFDFMNEYWNFLVAKDLEKAKTEQERKVLTKLKKPV